MRGSTSAFIAVAFAGIAACEASTVAPVAQPTPCPCAADGVCYPKRNTWGYYQGRWRQWPGDTRPEIPGPAEPPKEADFPPELPQVEMPKPEDEESRAPVSRREREAREEERVGEDGAMEEAAPVPFNGLNVPPLDFPFPPEPDAGAPGLEAPPAAPNRGLNLDPPPGLPFPPERLGEPGASRQRSLPNRVGTASENRHDTDLPPVLPSSLTGQPLSSASSGVSRPAVQRLPFVTTRPVRKNHLPQAHIDVDVRPASAAMPASPARHVIGRAVFSAPATGGNVIAR